MPRPRGENASRHQPGELAKDGPHSETVRQEISHLNGRAGTPRLIPPAEDDRLSPKRHGFDGWIFLRVRGIEATRALKESFPDKRVRAIDAYGGSWIKWSPARCNHLER